jgi:Protein of unknown function (DUF3352)
MSSSTPSSGEPEYVELGHERSLGPRPGLVVAIVVGVVAALALPLSAFAIFRFLSGGGTQPADVLPGNAVGYLRVDLDPSAPQKMEAVRFLRTFPAFEKHTHITDDGADVRETIFDAMLGSASCEVDYEQDVAPWLGERFGVAVMSPTAGDTGDTGPTLVGAVQVTDRDAADEGLRRLQGCHRGGEPAAGWSYLDGYMVVAKSRQEAADFAAAARRTPLADNEQFRSDMDRLGEQGVASLWFSGEGVYQMFSSKVTGDPGPAGSELDLMRDQVRRQVESTIHSGAAAFRFDDSYLELATVLTGDAYQEPADGAVADMALPRTTAAALGFVDGAKHVDRHSDVLLGMMAGGAGATDPERARRRLEEHLGLNFPEDVKTLVGDSFTVALDGEGLGLAAMAGRENPSLVDLGARSSTDTDAFRRVVQTLQEAAGRNGMPVELAVEGTQDGAAVALNKDYAARLASGGPLPDTAVFDKAVPAADEAQSVLFVNVDVLESSGLGMMSLAGGGMQELLANVTRIEAVGASSTVHDGYAQGVVRITVGQ